MDFQCYNLFSFIKWIQKLKPVLWVYHYWNSPKKCQSHWPCQWQKSGMSSNGKKCKKNWKLNISCCILHIFSIFRKFSPGFFATDQIWYNQYKVPSEVSSKHLRSGMVIQHIFPSENCWDVITTFSILFPPVLLKNAKHPRDNACI